MGEGGRENKPNIMLKIVIKSQGKREKEVREKRITKHPENKMAKSTYLSIITLNVKGSYIMIKWDFSQGCKDGSIITDQSM